ncbi:MAG: tripartite tricarboxylate transporter substrate binding protein [Burkholderiales bacterium]
MKLHAFPAAAALAATLALPCVAAYPERPITLVVPFATGGMGTLFGNLVSEVLTPALGQKVLVDYRPGAAGALGAGAVAKSAPDGYTLLMAVNSTMTVNPHLYAKLPYDPVKDFAPVSMVWTSANIVAVNANSPVKSIKDLLDSARASPGRVTYGSAGQGTTVHLCGEMLSQVGNVKMSHVPYKGAGPAIVDLLGGQIDLVCADTSMLPQITAGKLRALGVTSPKRMSVLPDVPTVEEQGLKGFGITSWYSIVAPAGTPKDVVEKLNQELGKALHSPAIRERIQKVGAEPADDTSAAYLENVIKSDLAKWKKFIAETGIKLE